MIAGNLYTTQQNAGKQVKRRGGIGSFLLAVGMLLFSVSSVAQSYVQATNGSGTTKYNGVDVTVTSSGSVSLSSPCGSVTGPYLLTGGSGSYTYTFSAPVGSVKISGAFAVSGTGQIHVDRNGSAYSITDANLAGTVGSCAAGVLAVAIGGDLTNFGNTSSDPNNIVVIPGPITSITVSNVATTGFVYGLSFTPTVYRQVTHTSGSSTVNGITVTATASGGASSFSPCGPVSGPYFSPSAGSAYTFTFSPSVDGVNVPVVFAAGGTPGGAHFDVNGSSVTLTSANINGEVAHTCSPAAAVVVGGDLSNSGNEALDPSGNVQLPNSSTVSSMAVTSTLANGFIHGLFIAAGSTPALTFNNASPQSLSVCTNAAATSINSQLAVTDLNSGLTLTWTVVVPPLHGTIVTGGTQTSTGGSVTPTGFTYQPTAAYSGTDGYTIEVSDGINTVSTVVNVLVSPTPDVTNFSIAATAPCQGSGSTITINSTSLVAGTYNVTYNLSGANSATGVIGSVTMASNTGTFLTSSLTNAGSTTITITNITNPCTSTTVSAGNVTAFTVNANPAAIFVPGSVCVGSTMTVTDGTAGGTWTSSNTGLATVVAGTGVVTGVGAGNPIMTYSLGTGCFVTTPITVNPTPVGITGSNLVCTGSTVALANATSGGTWSSSNAGVASIGSTGVVTGVVAGTPTISYTLPAGCFALFPMTVNTTPSANTGSAVVCTGLTTTLANGTGGGTWTSSNTGQATVGSASGVVTGVSAGNPVITYTVPNACYVTTVMTVNTTPAAITGASGVCVGANTTLNSSTGGGTWTSSNTLLATVGSSTGLVTGVAVGTPTISYTVSNGCFVLQPMTVNPNPASIAGTFMVCTGTTTTLSDATGGGLWSSSNTGLATVGAGTGVVSGVSAGTPTISYTLATGCFATQAVTVNTSPASIGGSTTVCVGATTTLTNSTPSGTWTSSNITLATVGSSSGTVTGVAAGSVTITYTLSTGCFSILNMTVNSNPAAIAGTFTVCTGGTTALTDGTSGGTWSSSNNSLATVGTTGIVTGVASGTPTISYTISGCSATQVITVNPTPVAIGGPSAVCVGANITLTDATSGGTWTSSSTGLATVGSSTGIVTGVSSGIPTITYSLSTGCFATYPVTVNPSPAGIAGSTTVCTGSSTTLTNTTSGGSWTSSDVTKATVGAGTGIVAGVAAGNVTITYTLATGCFSTYNMTVNPTPNAITGTTSVCVGFTTTLSDATSGGSWTSSNTSLATIVAGTGVATGVASGITVISYTLPTGCYATTLLTVNPIPAAIGGSPIVCVGSFTTLTDATTGGSWSSSNTALATIGSSTGTMTGVAAGNPVITYTTAAGCITTVIATIDPLPAAVSGTMSVCIGFTTTLSDATTGGTWTSSNTSIATVVAGTGVVTGVATGVATITYTLPTGCIATANVTVNPNPAAITGTTNVCEGLTTPLFDATGGGTWTSSNTGFATVGASSGVVTGVSAGTLTITYTLSTGCFATTALTVNPNPAGITGTTSVCVGLSTTLASATTGGTWTSSNPGQATVVAGTGVVTGVAAGTPTITYTLPTGCIATTVVTVNALPTAITGTPIVCTGYTTTLGSTPSGGLWSSSNVGQATVNAGTGVVTGVAAGNPVITYTLPTGCINTVIATVNATPAAIAGTMTVCVGLTTTLTDATTGGTWSSSNTSQATVVAGTGVVTGVAAGTPIITYTMPTGCYIVTQITVNSNPAAITGATSVCTGSTIGLADATVGGTWSSSDITKATIGTSSGVVTGVAAGTPTITYSLATGCIAVYPITVNTTPAAITGTMTVCTGFTTTLASATTGGTWSSSNTAEATVGAGTGVVTGVGAGTPVITYTMSTGCFVTAVVTVNPTPASITGTTQVCVGLTTNLFSTTTGGTWSSSNTSLATVGSSTGVVTGVATGTPNISYTMPTGCYVFSNITVNPTPAAVAGPTVVCVGSNITLTDATSGGIWSSGNTSIATVVAGTGVVTGVTAGVVGMTYTLGAGCTATYVITVNPVPDISNFTSTTATSPCVGGNSTVTVSSTSLGAGTFTVTYNLSGANAVTGATATMTMGSTTGTFTIPSSSLTSSGFTTVTITMVTNSFGCNSFPFSGNASTFSVNPLPTVYTVTGGGAYCSGGTGVHIYLSNSVGGVNYQLWLGATAVGAPVAGTFSGLDFGLITTVGTYTVTATNATTGCMSNMAGSASVSIDPLPTVFTVTGGGAYCSGGTGVAVGLSGSVAATNYQLYIGGVATGSPVAGTGSAISFGLQTAAGTYTVVATDASTLCTNNMTGSAAVTINPLPASITGTMFLCPGTTTTLSDATTGGTWSSSTPGVATVGSSTGVVTGVTSGTSIISYTLSTGCLTTATVTVNPNPAAISGATSVCVGLAITMSDATGGGTWTSSNTSLATVNITTGVVTGVAAGTPTITYTLSTGCLATLPITVNPVPASIAGTMSACVGANSTLTNAVSGGTWTSSNGSVATVGSSSGIVGGVAAGTVTITYTLPAGCFTTASFTVNPIPATITGTTNVCVGLTTTLANAVSGGTWSSSNSSIASVGAVSGIVTGVAAGTATMTYTLPAGCFTTTLVTVNPTPAVITGTNNVCIGLSTTLSDATTGGTWSSSNPATASIGSATGIVTGVAAGSVTITYTLPAGCFQVFAFTVNPNPAAITGVASVCVGSSTTLGNATTGGSWTSSNVSLATVGAGTGIVNGIASGVPTVTYTLSTGCLATIPVTVNPLPSAITGITTVCTGSSVTLSDASSGGSWTSNNTSIATVVAGTGVVTGVAAGTTTITYTLPTGCLTTTNITVNPTPAAISGSSFVCVGLSTTLSDATSGGVWSSSNTSLATVGSSTGVVNGIAVGTPYITYTLPAGCFSTMMISVNPVPASVTGVFTVCEGATTTLSDATSGGTWTSGNTSIAVVGSSTGVVTGVAAGSVNITYTLPGGCTATAVVTVYPSPAAITGTNNVCVGLTTTLANAVTGGTWTSSNTAVATIGSASGIVSGLTAGSITITYTLPAGCFTTYAFTVNPLPAAITGVATLCEAGGTTTLFDATSGGTWTSSNTARATIGSTTGVVTGLTAGTVTMTYTLPTGCITTTVVTVNPLPTVFTVSGGGTYCAGGTGATITLSGSQSGVSYQLYIGTTAIGSPVSGTGSAISFGLQTTAGTYTAVATNTTTTCQNNMSGSATVTVTLLPTVYNMTGGGNYCAGGTGVTVGLNGSQVGVSYQLYNGSAPVGSPIAGTGSSISWGLISGAGTYTAVAVNTVTTCSSNMAGTSVVIINPLPTQFTVTGGGAYCTGASGVVIGLSSSTSGVNYTVTNGIVSATLAGTGGALNFGLFTSLGTYTVNAINTTTFCTNTMLGSASVTVNPVPNVLTVTGGGVYCAGGTGVVVGVASPTQVGVSYQLFLGSSPVGSAVAGTGGAISFGLQVPTGTYSVVATNGTTGCTSNMGGTVVISTNPLPVPQSVTGGGGYCFGGTGSVVSVANTVVGTSYQLYRGVTIVGSSIAGTGAAISFPAQTVAGTYTVLATITATGCTATMPGSAVITINPLPNLYSVTGGGNFCTGSTGVPIGMSASDVGINYQLWLGSSAIGAPLAGTGSALSFGIFTVPGTYTVIATNPLTGCVATMSSSALVVANPLPALFPVSGGGSYCAGGTGVTITLPGSVVGTTYQLMLGVTPVGIAVLGTGSSISFGPATAAGIYTVSAQIISTGCTRNMTGVAVVAINPLPTVNIVSGGGSYCAGGAGVHILLNGSVTGNNYQLLNGSTLSGTPLAGTGAALDFGFITAAGTYTVVATNTTTGCSNTMTGSATVVINPLPALYNVTGGGGYCAGSAGVPVGVDGSNTGVSYQLFNGSTPLGSPVAGTGSAIDFGFQTTVGTYTVVATDDVTGCTATMTGSVLVNVNPLPTMFTVSGGGSYCPGGAGVVVGLGGSVSGVNYQLMNGTSTVGSLVPGTGIAISFGLQTGVGTYTVVAIDATTGCSRTMTGAAVVSLSPLPAVFNVIGGGGYCLGGTGSTVMLSGSVSGVNYQLYLGSATVGAPMIGTGTSLNFGPQTAAGVYTVVATTIVTGCSNNMTGSATVSVNPLPVAYNVTGGGGYCAGGTGVLVGLSNSDATISYQLMRGFTMVGSPLAGTGGAISFGLQTIAGTYTVVATNSITGCVNNMTGSATVMINALPIAYMVTGGGSYCAGGTGVHVGLMVSDLGVTYQLMSGTTPVGATMAGTGGALDYGWITAAGTYTVVATDVLTGCTMNMTGSVTVVVNPLPNAFAVTGGGSFCATGTGVHVGLAGSNTGISYQLYNDMVAAGAPMSGTGASLDFGLMTAGGNYTVVATNASTGCVMNMTGSATVVVNPLPNADTVTGGGSYCPGGAGVHVGLTSSTSGISYQLFRGTTSIGAPMTGTGSGLDFGSQTIVGTYFVVATNPATGCTMNMTGSAAVNISPLPTLFNVGVSATGYCAGGTGVHVTLSGSSIGTNYQLYIGTLALGSPMPGTGFALDFGLQTSPGVYSVVATSTITGCVNNMTGTPSITINPLPTVYTVTGGGSYCAGGTGVNVYQSGSDMGINYQLMRGSVAVGTPMAGTGYSLDFGPQTGAGTYTVVATNAVTGCVRVMLSSATIAINPLPTVYFVVGGGSYCAGDAGIHVGINNSETGINYQLMNGTTAMGSPMAGTTGLGVDFGFQTMAGTYTVVATNAITGCTITMSGSATIAINPLPATFAVTGGGNYCTGGTGVHVGLGGSASTGVTYELLLDGVGTGTSIAGTGGAIDFGIVTGAGTYTVRATNTATGCTSMMSGSTLVTISPLPLTYTVTGGGSYCASTPGVAVGLGGSNSGINYQLYNGTTTVGGLVAGTGGPITFGLQPAGIYTVIAIDATTGCSSNMTGSVTVTMTPSVVPSVTITTGVGDTVCAGTMVNFTPLTVNGGTAPTFEWFVNGVSVGSGSSYSYIPTNGNVVTVTMTSNATCVLPATASGSITMTVRANVTPVVSISVSPNDTVCEGTVVTFTPTAINGGSAPAYSWFVNGVPAGTSSTYAYAPANGDVVFTSLNSSYACLSTNNVLSNNIALHVDDNSLPTISITENAGANVGAVVYTDTFTAVVTNGGGNPSYQWSLNGAAITGATNSTYVAGMLNNGDAISCVVSKVNACGLLSANAMVIVLSTNVGVQPVVTAGSDIKLVPNPNKGIFTLKGTMGSIDDQEVSIEVTNMLGQVIYTAKVIARNGVLNQTVEMSKTLANGMYMLNLSSGTEHKVFHVVIEQ